MDIMSIVLLILLLVSTGSLIFLLRRAGRRVKAAEDGSREAELSLRVAAVKLESIGQALDAETTRNREAAAKIEQLTDALAQSREEAAARQSRLDTLEEEKKKLDLEYEARFKRLAESILQANSKSLSEVNSVKINELLSPVKTTIENFTKEFKDSYERESKDRYSLKNEVENLAKASSVVKDEARRLTDALKGNTKVQGDWGELILDSILSQSGLRKGIEYDVQKVDSNEEGNSLKPDVVINLPDGKKIVIDSKVSLKDYTEMLESEDESLRKIYLKKHIDSIKKHITELKTKKYQDIVGKDRLDFVIMFFPSEGAYVAAIAHEPRLWDEAFAARVMILTPPNLTATLKMIYHIWGRQRSNENALAIAQRATAMLDKLSNSLEHVYKIGKGIEAAQKSYDAALTSLCHGKGNLIMQAEDLKKLGVKMNKSLPKELLKKYESDADMEQLTEEDRQVLPEVGIESEEVSPDIL